MSLACKCCQSPLARPALSSPCAPPSTSPGASLLCRSRRTWLTAFSAQQEPSCLPHGLSSQTRHRASNGLLHQVRAWVVSIVVEVVCLLPWLNFFFAFFFAISHHGSRLPFPRPPLRLASVRCPSVYWFGQSHLSNAVDFSHSTTVVDLALPCGVGASHSQAEAIIAAIAQAHNSAQLFQVRACLYVCVHVCVRV